MAKAGAVGGTDSSPNSQPTPPEIERYAAKVLSRFRQQVNPDTGKPWTWQDTITLLGETAIDPGAIGMRVLYNMALERREEAQNEEVALERNPRAGAVKRYKKLAGMKGLTGADAVLARWFKVLCDGLMARLETSSRGSKYDSRLRKMLRRNSVETIAALAVDTVIRVLLELPDDDNEEAQHPGETPLRTLLLALGYAVWGEDVRRQFENERKGDGSYDAKEAWTPIEAAQYGKRLLAMLVGGAAEDFGHETRGRPPKQESYIWLTPDCATALCGKRLAKQSLPLWPPMMIEPVPWTQRDEGGYLWRWTPLIRTQDAKRWSLKSAGEDALDVLNQLGRVRWRINKWLLDVMVRAESKWKTGAIRRSLMLPPHETFNLPPPPRMNDQSKESRVKQRLAYREEQSGAVKRCNAWLSRLQRCELARIAAEQLLFWSKIETARSMAGKCIRLPHSFDFRGRVYPVPQPLNHIGDDIARSLLEFADPVFLRDAGEQWLRIHLANTCGRDRTTFDERLQWVADNEKMIRSWAEDPMRHTEWREVKKPWAALAAARALCDEVAAQHLPVAVDASSSALQHIAALTGDEETAVLVNLIPLEQPADLYTTVAKQVKNALKDRWEDHVRLIDRDVVKTAAMTWGYGVGDAQARRQIEARLIEVGFSDAPRTFANAIRKALFEAAAKLFPAVGAFHEWVRGIGEAVGEHDTCVTWESPLGLRIVQDGPAYRDTSRGKGKPKPKGLYVNLAGREKDYHVTVNRPYREYPINSDKQGTALTANLIHSLDSTHLGWTVQACAEQNIPIAGIHDCVLAHAERMDTVQGIIREQFIRLHGEDQREAFQEHVATSCPEIELPGVPPKGNLDITHVRDSRYFFH